MTVENKQTPFFSIVVVALNPGDKLIETIESIRAQSFTDYEVIVKDGGSKDGSVAKLEEYLAGWPEGEGKVKIICRADSSIYDGMNQAVEYTSGTYLYFLNCGDHFAEESALELATAAIAKDKEQSFLYYGDIKDALREQIVSANPHIDAFACYRHLPCHQACIYHRSLFAERGYEPKYRVRADYEHFLWCFFVKKVQPKYIAVTLASYEGGGFSETPENRKRSAAEHKEITALYMSKGQLLRYKLILLLTLAPLRSKMAESEKFAGFYQRCKSMLYGKRK